MTERGSAGAKERAIDQWTADPAGAVLAADKDQDSLDFYRKVQRTRYELYPWLLEFLTPRIWQGKRTLEIGVGLGTDHLMLHRAGADLVGIDLTPASIEHTRRRFALEGVEAHVQVADAEALPFPDSAFDSVYSFGVLHHTPDLDNAVLEVLRVLVPGGTAVISLYNRDSYFHAWRLLRYVARGEWRTLGLDGMQSGFEYGRGSPLVVLSSHRQARSMFRSFTSVTIEARHLPTHRLPSSIRPTLDRALGPVERRFGWYWMIVASK